MNCSKKTKLIAEGMAKRAAFLDEPVNASGTVAEIEWSDWQRRYPQWVIFVQEQHDKLFDLVNAKF